MTARAEPDTPSAWVQRFAALIPDGEVLDLACGNGRHARLLASLGHAVLALDRDRLALANCAGPGIATHQINLENGAPDSLLAFGPRRFSGIVVTNYLHRPLFAQLVASLAPNGVLIYETFAIGNEQFGKPSNPDFLLAPGELLQLAALDPVHPLQVIAYEDGYVELPKPAMLQRICAVKAKSTISAAAVRLI